MIFVDTNYFLRFLIADEPAQHEKAKKLFLEGAEGKKKLFTSLVVLFEVYWVLTSFYQKNKREVAKILNQVLQLEFIRIEDREVLKKAIGIYQRKNLDLEDSYNLAYAKAKGASALVTFDLRLKKAFAK